MTGNVNPMIREIAERIIAGEYKAVLVSMIVADEEGFEESQIYHIGGRTTALGLAYNAVASLSPEPFWSRPGDEEDCPE